MKNLYLIGYEGATATNLLQTLSNVGVEVLADVRELPLSRKKGLSKSSLTDAASEFGIEYIHFKKLGDPKPGRDAAKAGNYAEFERVFLNHLATPAVQSDLDDLLKIAKIRATCMMCFERCSSVCHRSYLADQATLQGFNVYNLVPDRPEAYLRNEIKIPRYNPRKSVAAAE